MGDVKDDIDVDNLFRELNDAATEENDSPLAAVQYIKILQSQLTILQAEKERLAGELGEALGLLSVAQCPNCDGGGAIVSERTRTVAGCCGHFLPTGECCGNAIPVPELEQCLEQCQWCAMKNEAIEHPTQEPTNGG